MHVSANLAVSLDGRITAAGSTRTLGSSLDRARMHALRAGADAILAGGSTLRAWPVAWAVDPAAVARAHAAGLASTVAPARAADRPLLNVVLTRGSIPLDAPRFWHDARTLPLALSTVPLHVPRGTCVTRPEWNPRGVLGELAVRGVRRLLLEGGGGLLGPFLAEGLVDTLHLTLCPLVLGGGAPLVAAVAPWTHEGAPRLRLVTAQPVGDEVFLTYARVDGYDTSSPGDPA